MSTTEKDTIYVDIDDEITTIIDKVRSSGGRIVALVLPKRATVFQSIVNMKLLKRAAEVAKKHIVLITTEANLMPLAGAVGLHVAATPQSRPEVPVAVEPSHVSDLDEEEVAEDDEYTADTAGNRPIGELAQRSGHVVPPAASDMVSLDGEDAEEAEDEDERPVRDRKLSVPNFNRFRVGLFLSIFGLVAVIVGLYFALTVLPKAAIAITTNTSAVNVDMNLVLDTSAQALDKKKLVVPAKSEQQQKTSQQQVATTGQKNNGAAATGSVTLTACEKSFGLADPVPAGTGVSVNGLTYITQTDTQFSHSGSPNGNCFAYTATAPTTITAQAPGAKYNVTNAKFSLAGRSDVTASGSATGGTDQIIKTVAQADIDSAKQKLTAQDTEAIKASLEQALRTDSMYPLDATFNAGTPIVTTSNNVGDTADNVTVTQAVTYTMLGVKKADLDMLIMSSVSSQIDTKDQTISDDGLGRLSATLGNVTGTTTQLSLQTTATVGPQIDPANIKKQAAGKKIGDVKSMVNGIPGVTNVDVRLSPFWVSTVPSDPAKVTITIGKAK